jgi:hypothetical protein
MSLGQSIHAISVGIAVDDATLESGLKRAGTRASYWAGKMVEGMSKAFQQQNFEQSVINRLGLGSNEIVEAQRRTARDNATNDREMARQRQRAAEDAATMEELIREENFAKLKEEYARIEKEQAEHNRRMQEMNSRNQQEMLRIQGQPLPQEIFRATSDIPALNADQGYQALKAQLADEEAASLGLTKARLRDQRAERENEILLLAAKEERLRVAKLNNALDREGNANTAEATRLIAGLSTAQDLHNKRVQRYQSLLEMNLITQAQFDALSKKSAVDAGIVNPKGKQQAIDKIRQILASTGNEQAKINQLTANHKRELAELNKAMNAAGVSLKQQAIQRRILLQHQREELDLLKNKRKPDEDAKLAEQVIRRTATAQEAHNQRVADYTRLLNNVNKATGKNYLTQEQYNRAVAESVKIMNSSRGGSGAATGMMAQASFAIEDFIQGVAFGDIRSGILGASNNLTMVARGALQASEGMTILGMTAGKFMAVVLGLPAAVIAVGAAFSWLNRAERDTRSLTDALKDAEHGFDRLRAAQDRREQIQQQHREIANIKDMESHDQKRVLLLEQQDNIKRRMQQEEAKTTRLGSEMLLNTIGGKDAEAELRQLIHSLRNSGNEMAAAMGTDMEKALGDAFNAARRGEVEKMIDALRVLNSLGYQMQQNLLTEDFTTGGAFADLQNLINDPTALDSLQAIFNTGFLMQTEDQAKLRELRDEMVSINEEKLKLQGDTKANGEALQKLEERRLEIQKEMRNLEEQAEKVQRSKIEGIIVEEQIRRRMALEAMKMTEEQRRTAELQREMNEFIGFDPMAMAGLGLQGMLAAGQGQALGLQFLQAKADQLQKEMDKATQAPVIQGALEKDAFKAQADALKQAIQAANKKPDPQLEAQRALLQQIRDAIANGNVFFQGVP